MPAGADVGDAMLPPAQRRPKLSWEFVEEANEEEGSRRFALSTAQVGVMTIGLCVILLGFVEGREMRRLLGSSLYEPNTWFKNKPYWQSTEELQERLSADGQPFSNRHANTDRDVGADDDDPVEVSDLSTPSDRMLVDGYDGPDSARRRRLRRLAQVSDALEVGGAGSLPNRPSWPPPQCKGILPVSRPRLASSRGGRRRLMSEAPTKLLVHSKPPDAKLQLDVYDYLRDVMSSPTMCRPRSLGTGKLRCAGSGGGMSCRGADLPVCEPAPAPSLTDAGCTRVVPWRRPPIVLGTADDKVMQPGALGSCAFIATGETVLRGSFAKDIDAHDTVIRYNTPIKGFEKHVGTKTTLMWTKSKYGTTAKPTMGFIDSGGARDRRMSRGSKMFRINLGDVRAFRDMSHRMWYQARGIKEGKAAAGLTRAFMLLKSGLCTSISLYGFSTQSQGRGGKYFARKAVVTPGHAIDWDGWLLKALMDLGYLCVYGE